MSLRDYLAGQTLASGIRPSGETDTDTLAALVYEMADAMLVEREKPEGQTGSDPGPREGQEEIPFVQQCDKVLGRFHLQYGVEATHLFVNNEDWRDQVLQVDKEFGSFGLGERTILGKSVIVDSSVSPGNVLPALVMEPEDQKEWNKEEESHG